METSHSQKAGLGDLWDLFQRKWFYDFMISNSHWIKNEEKTKQNNNQKPNTTTEHFEYNETTNVKFCLTENYTVHIETHFEHFRHVK